MGWAGGSLGVAWLCLNACVTKQSAQQCGGRVVTGQQPAADLALVGLRAFHLPRSEALPALLREYTYWSSPPKQVCAQMGQ